ncbi:MAG: HEAT repeat domain-containing protein [Terriglobia bacterium]
MPFLLEHIIELVWAMILLILTGTGLLITITVIRRKRREEYFRRIDALRDRYNPLIAALLDGKLDYELGRNALNAIAGRDRIHVLELLLLQKKPQPLQTPILRQLCQELGLVEVWQHNLTGANGSESWGQALARTDGVLGQIEPLCFLLRAASAENLGIILHQPSWPLLVKALRDDYPDVGSVAARSLAAIGEPESFQALWDRLCAVILDPLCRVSLRSIKMALISFPIGQANKLLPALEHSNGRIRFQAVDIIREMAEQQVAGDEKFVLDGRTFTTELAEIFLGRLCLDDNADVRARAAAVISIVADPRATPVLLTLLEDPQWFVRLHAARALAKRKDLSRAKLIAHRLTDSQWMVREAVTRTLLAYGRPGLDELLDQLLKNQDRYAKEQIADAFQRAGLLPTLLEQYAKNGDGIESRVLEQLVRMGKTSYIVAVLANGSDERLRGKFLANFGRHTDPQIRSWVAGMATHEPDLGLRHKAVNIALGLPQMGGI